eukprot:410314-Prorocentrum_minimum.AAC.1
MTPICPPFAPLPPGLPAGEDGESAHCLRGGPAVQPGTGACYQRLCCGGAVRGVRARLPAGKLRGGRHLLLAQEGQGRQQVGLHAAVKPLVKIFGH